jgi:hypothetical protein
MTGFPQRFYTLSKRILQNKFVPFLIEKFQLSHIDKGVINATSIGTVRVTTLGIEETPRAHRGLSAHSEYTL